MRKMLSKWWIWLIASISFLIIVQILFSIPAPCKWLDAVWEAGDFISFVGTMVLGYVAISQTERANKMSERLMDIENNRYKLDIRPFVMITDWKAYELASEQLLFNPDKLYIQIGEYADGIPALGIGLLLQNTTDSFLTVEYSGACSQKVKWTNSTINQPNRKLRLSSGESSEIVFYASSEYMTSLISEFITVKLIMENRFADRYQESFDLLITTLTEACIHKEGEWYCDVTAQNYQIGKFVKDGDGKIILKMEDSLNG